MLPQGLIWQYLRQRALEVVPVTVFLPRTTPPTLSHWLQNGAYSVTSAASGQFTIAASPTEIGCALLSEAAFHLDHAAEHSVTVRQQLDRGRWYSIAWLCVTFYYWAFFLALSFTRMLGNTAVFLSRSEAHNLCQLANVSTRSVGAGPYILKTGSLTTSSSVDVLVKRATSSRVHDLTWRLVFDEIARAAALGRSGRTDTNEIRLFSALDKTSRILGPSWPSDLRNSVNYLPGFGYSAVRHVSIGNFFGHIRANIPLNFEDALDRLEHSLSEISGGDLENNTAAAARTLTYMTFAFDEIMRLLHTDVIERRNIDARWLNARKEFLRDQFKSYDPPDWPYVSNIP